jgi:hypothetical protein
MSGSQQPTQDDVSKALAETVWTATVLRIALDTISLNLDSPARDITTVVKENKGHIKWAFRHMPSSDVLSPPFGTVLQLACTILSVLLVRKVQPGPSFYQQEGGSLVPFQVKGSDQLASDTVVQSSLDRCVGWLQKLRAAPGQAPLDVIVPLAKLYLALSASGHANPESTKVLQVGRTLNPVSVTDQTNRSLTSQAMRTCRVMTTDSCSSNNPDQESVASLLTSSSFQQRQDMEEKQRVAGIITTFKEDRWRAKVLSALKATSSLTQECTASQVIDVVQGQRRNLLYALGRPERNLPGYPVYFCMTILLCRAQSALLLTKTDQPVFKTGSSNVQLRPFSQGREEDELVQF